MNENKISQVYARFAYACGSLVFVTGIIYLILQWNIKIENENNTIFISMSLGASIFILYFARNIINHIINNGPSFYTATISLKDPTKSKIEYDKLLRIFTNFKLLIPFSFIWGAIASFIPFYFNTYPDNLLVNIFFGLFLFAICFITGVFLLMLISFFIISKKLWDLINVELWKRDNTASEFLLSLSKKTSFVAALYISICLTAWVTSIITISTEFLIFSIFSVALLIGSVIIPIRPFTMKLLQMKHNALGEIDEKIQKEYLVIIKNLNEENKTISFDQMNLLIEMRKKIEEIQVYPYRIKTLTASLSIILISLFPILVQFILDKLK